MADSMWLSATHKKTVEGNHIIRGEIEQGFTINIVEGQFAHALREFEEAAEEILGDAAFSGTIIRSENDEVWSFPLTTEDLEDTSFSLAEMTHKLDSSYDAIDEVVADMRKRGWDGLAERTHRLYEALYIDAIEVIEQEEAVLAASTKG